MANPKTSASTKVMSGPLRGAVAGKGTGGRGGPAEAAGRADDPQATASRHVKFGWWMLLLFLSLGMVLETFHGFKIQWYLAATNETRQLLWRLAHAHGTLLAIVNIVFGLMVASPVRWRASYRTLASRCLIGATLLLPGGFFLGGVAVYGGDPSPGILLVPFGALLLLVGTYLSARAASASWSRDRDRREATTAPDSS